MNNLTSNELHPWAQYCNPDVAILLQSLNLDKEFIKGEGCFLWDKDGIEYVDFLAAYGCSPFGFNPSELWKEIWRIGNDKEPVFIVPSVLQGAGELAKKLVQLFPPMKFVTFTNSGTESTEAAIKLARASTGRSKILSTWNGFHGNTLGSLSATGKPKYQKPFGAPFSGFHFIPFGDVLALKQEFEMNIAGQYAAFIIEPIQGEGGVQVPPDGYLKVSFRKIISY